MAIQQAPLWRGSLRLGRCEVVTSRPLLYKMALEWEQSADPRDLRPFKAHLDELLFHADTRFHEYEQFREDGEYAERLLKWVNQVDRVGERQALFELARRVCFVDHKQTQSLYREAFRGPVAKTVSASFGNDDWVAPDFYDRVRAGLRDYALFSITESFIQSDFYAANSMAGAPRVQALGEDLDLAATVAGRRLRNRIGAIVFEDFVGSGNQAVRVLQMVLQKTDVPVLFVPLVVHPDGLGRLRDLATEQPLLTVAPVMVIQEEDCVRPTHRRGEPGTFPAIRSTVRETESRVMVPRYKGEQLPSNPFGFGGSGAVFVSYRNSPNNVLALVHHRAPDWEPLFRRVDHWYGRD
jgi:hypothetical protein